MPSMSVEELKERLIRDLPGALAPARAKAEPHKSPKRLLTLSRKMTAALLPLIFEYFCCKSPSG